MEPKPTENIVNFSTTWQEKLHPRGKLTAPGMCIVA